MATLFLLGCGDVDGDGLNSRQEARYGTNPNLPDTDGDRLLDGEEIQRGSDPLAFDTDLDGYADGDEVTEGTDPLDNDDRIYQGGWPYRHDKDVLGHQGFDEPSLLGSKIPRLQSLDGFGDTVDLYDFSGTDTPVLIEISSMFIATTESLAAWRNRRPINDTNNTPNAARRALHDNRLRWVTVMTEGPQTGIAPTPEDLADWRQRFPDVVVMLDPDGDFAAWASEPGFGSQNPLFIWATEDMKVRRIDRSTDPLYFYTLNLLSDHFEEWERENGLEPTLNASPATNPGF